MINHDKYDPKKKSVNQKKSKEKEKKKEKRKLFLPLFVCIPVSKEILHQLHENRIHGFRIVFPPQPLHQIIAYGAYLEENIGFLLSLGIFTPSLIYFHFLIIMIWYSSFINKTIYPYIVSKSHPTS